MGKRGKPCSACNPSLCSKVDALIAAGVSYAEIGATVGLSKHTIARHARHSAHPVSETENLDELQVSDQRLGMLLARLESQYNAAVACGDNKVALDITKVAA